MMESVINNSVNVNLSNLTITGKNVPSWSSNFRTCIYSMANDINVDLSSGTLTLKSGSVITTPSGSQLQITTDKTTTQTTDGQYMVFPTETGGSIRVQEISNIAAGATDTLAGVANHYWYDTTNKVINRYAGDGTTVSNKMALPVCLITVNSGAISSIDTVFNGSGYVGTAIFVLPFVAGLAPNGFNSNKTLANYNIKINSLTVYTNTESTVTDSYIVRAYSGGLGRGYWTVAEELAPSGRTYIPSKNRVYTANGTEQPCFRICKYSSNSGVITDFSVEPVACIASLKDNNFDGINTVPDPAAGDNSQQIANTAWVCANASFGSTPRDITELADFNDAIMSNGNLNLSESWQNFQELVFVGSSGVNKGGTNVAFRISTYWLDYMLSNGYGCVVWAGYINGHLDVASYTAANPSTSSDLYVNSHAYCYLGKIYGVNRKAGS